MTRARAAGGVLLMVLGAILALNVAWIAGHRRELGPVSSGDVAPGFSVERVDGGGAVALEELRGRVVLLDFWATWCGPCRETLPAIERLHRKYGAEGLEVVSLNRDGPPVDRPALQRFAARYGLSFPIYVDHGQVAGLYKVDSIPHLVLVDRHGLVREEHTGVFRVSALEADLDAEIRALLAEP